MDKNLKILYIEDDVDNQDDLKEVLNNQKINDFTLSIDCETSFENAIVRSKDYHLIILDLYKGEATKNGINMGSGIFEDVKKSFFIPVIFYSGHISDVKDLKSQVIGVASKGDNIDLLKSEIERLTKHNIPFLRNNVHSYIEQEFKKYFWDVIQKENDKFKPDADDFSLGYLLLRNLADSLSKENIKGIIGDDTISPEKVHPMEFYIYPTNSSKEYENGEIIRNKKSDDIYVILTPSCDFIERFKKGVNEGRSVDSVLLIKTNLLTDYKEFKDYQQNQNKDNKQKLGKLINSGKSDRYFFLPQAPFIENRIVDFQLNTTVSYDVLQKDFERIAKLDSPFAQSMTSSFIRYYNRIGFPDIDTEYVINNLKL